MTRSKKELRTCENGHQYYKSSSCPVCPVCEKNRVPTQDFLAKLSAPARRALENAGIDTLHKLAGYSENDLLKLHGFGPGSLPKLREALKEKELSFTKD
ncbi:MAG: RNA polymerase alpha subunit C-terminal domain-containing protein [Bacteroidetes bacterium]|nr:RNA polymerase alpha subunit C-terminal domain-containing protein [Bacteroidota bacterium]